jgi:hypothetical protein
MKDTAKLRSMIQGLVYFSLFTEELRTNLDLCTISFTTQGMGTQPGESDKINVMKDFSDFIRNNNSSLNATIVMLSGFYGKEGGDASQDVERTFQDFGNYVNNMNKKDSILSQVLVNMDDYLLNSKTLQSRKAEFSQLKSIRDQLLIKGIQLGGLLSNKEVVVSRMKYAMDTQLKMGSTVDANNMPYTAKTLDLLIPMNMQSGVGIQLEGSWNAQVASQVESKVSAVVYDSKVLQFKVVDLQALTALRQTFDGAIKAGAVDAVLHSNELRSGNIHSIAMVGVSGDINIIMSQYSVNQIVSSKVLEGVSWESSIRLMGVMNALNANGSYSSSISPVNAAQAFAASSLEGR